MDLLVMFLIGVVALAVLALLGAVIPGVMPPLGSSKGWKNPGQEAERLARDQEERRRSESKRE